MKMPLGAPMELRCSTLFSLCLTITITIAKGKVFSLVVDGATELLVQQSYSCASPYADGQEPGVGVPLLSSWPPCLSSEELPHRNRVK